MSLARTARLVVPLPALLGTAGVLVGVEVAALVSQRDVLRSWASVVEVVDGTWLVLGILVVGCSAALSVQPWQHREMTAALPDSGARSVAAVGVVLGLVASGVHLLTVAVLIGWGCAVALPGQPRLWPVLSVLAGLCACAMFGTGVARFGAGMLSPLLAMCLYVGALVTIRVFGGNDLVDLGGASVVLVGLAPDTQVVMWRTGWLVSAGAVTWGVAAYGRRALRRAPFLVLVVTTVVVATTAAQKADAGFVATPVEWVCESGPPKVCVAAEYDDRLDDYAAALTRMAPAAGLVGLPEPSDGYRQTVGIRPGPGSFNVDAHVIEEQLAFDLVQFTLPCSTRWDEQQLQRADVVAAWMAWQAGSPSTSEVRSPSRAQAVRALSELRCGS